jgi:hypothetical protein
MNVFISWSGERSKMVAKALKTFLENLFQTIEVFMSESDIEPGTRWSYRLIDELQKSNYGIICLTPENRDAQWILFEAGALSNQVKNRVTPLLFQLEFSEVKGPLSQFQYLSVDEGGLRKLSSAINDLLEKPLHSDKLKEYFQIWWGKLSQSISEIPLKPKESLPNKRQDRELLEEILQYTRNQTLNEAKIIRLRAMSQQELQQMEVGDIVDYIKNAVVRLGEGITPSEIVQMKKKILLAVEVLKEKNSEMAEKVNAIIVKSIPGIENIKSN